MIRHTPKYTKLFKTGELENRITILKEKLKCCVICPHHCKVDRTNNERGFCKAGENMVIDGYGPHYGEEDVLVGTGGSGTIFFSYCTLQCVFCQNCEISQYGEGYEVSSLELSQIMLSLQKRGCHNINLVSPSHYVPQIVESIHLAVKEGLSIPIIYNTGGYDDINTLKLLDGVIDIYMPDIKFGDNMKAKKYARSARYFDIVKEAVREMYRQVGNLKYDDRRIAYKGLLIRHLVMPENLSDTDKILTFIAEDISKEATVNIMSQYYPAHKSYTFPEIAREITKEEYEQALVYAKKLGLSNVIISKNI